MRDRSEQGNTAATLLAGKKEVWVIRAYPGPTDAKRSIESRSRHAVEEF